MAEEKISWQLKNPCKYCLVKPACSRICELLKNHIEVFEVSTGCGILFGYVFLLIGLCIYSYVNWSKTLTWVGIALYQIGHYGFMLYHHLKSPHELRDMKKWERRVIIVAFPYAFLPVGLWHIFDHYCLTKYGYLYRYHKSLNPYTKKEEDF